MAPNASQTWSDKVHADVLLSMMDAFKPTQAQWDEVAKSTHKMGYTFTGSALRYKLAVLLFAFLPKSSPPIAALIGSLIYLPIQTALVQAQEKDRGRCRRQHPGHSCQGYWFQGHFDQARPWQG